MMQSEILKYSMDELLTDQQIIFLLSHIPVMQIGIQDKKLLAFLSNVLE